MRTYDHHIDLDLAAARPPVPSLFARLRLSAVRMVRTWRNRAAINHLHDLDDHQLLDIGLDAALAIYAEPKRGRGRVAAPPLREYGIDPVSEKPIVAKSGRFGDYITDGTTNVTIPRGETVESLTPERAVELLADKRAKGPAKKPARRAPAKKPAAKKKAAPKK